MIPAHRVLAAAVDLVLPAVLVVALHLFVVGHDAPGGGFIAGLVVAGALSLRSITHPATPTPRWLTSELLLGVGLLLALAVAALPLVVGEAMLTSGSVSWAVPALGKVKLSTVLVFDVGVLLVVVGLAEAVLERVREVLR